MTEEKRSRGRPRKKAATPFTFLFSDSLRNQLVVYCDKYGLNMTQAIEKAIQNMLKKEDAL